MPASPTRPPTRTELMAADTFLLRHRSQQLTPTTKTPPNWSNYSWFVGDIFGAPLAIEGIVAFFMEATFVAVMFFGWNRVSKRFHLASTWLTAAGQRANGTLL